MWSETHTLDEFYLWYGKYFIPFFYWIYGFMERKIFSQDSFHLFPKPPCLRVDMI